MYRDKFNCDPFFILQENFLSRKSFYTRDEFAILLRKLEKKCENDEKIKLKWIKHINMIFGILFWFDFDKMF